MENLNRICLPDFKPTDKDMLMLRTPTTGINEFQFKKDDNLFR